MNGKNHLVNSVPCVFSGHDLAGQGGTCGEAVQALAPLPMLGELGVGGLRIADHHPAPGDGLDLERPGCLWARFRGAVRHQVTRSARGFRAS